MELQGDRRMIFAPAVLRQALRLGFCLILGFLAMGNEQPPADVVEAAVEGRPEYIHKWIILPSFAATSVTSDETLQISAKPGRITILVFLASYCLACQQLLPAIRDIEDKFAERFTDTVYIFTHDTAQDAQAFANQYGIKKGVQADHTVLGLYHNPPTPTIYVGDRHGWMVTRFPLKMDEAKLSAGDLDELRQYLEQATAF